MRVSLAGVDGWQKVLGSRVDRGIAQRRADELAGRVACVDDRRRVRLGALRSLAVDGVSGEREIRAHGIGQLVDFGLAVDKQHFGRAETGAVLAGQIRRVGCP